MKMKNLHRVRVGANLQRFTPLGALLLAALSAQASADYGPAIWNPIPNNYYTSGNGHKFHVIHDMEGFYGGVRSVLINAGTSVHYAVNSGSGTSGEYSKYCNGTPNISITDNYGKAAGEISQFVAEANYAYHARCWNTHSTGTEHEGFVTNPAWYTEAQYQASALLTAHLASKFGWAKDRNHVVGHNEKSSSAWVSYAVGNLGMTSACATDNSHCDPGPYWNWSHYMALVNGATGGTDPSSKFETSADAWTANASSTAVGFTSGSWPEGVAYATQNGNDCSWKGPSTSWTGMGNGCVNVKVYPQNGTTAAHDMKVYYSTTTSPGFSELKSSPLVTYTKQNGYISLNFDVNGTNFVNKTINQLRLDFDGVNHSNTWIVDYIIPQSRPVFSFTQDAEGWMPYNGVASPLGWTAGSWPEGVIYMDQTNNDACIASSSLDFWGAANDYIDVRVYIQNSTSTAHDMQFYWRTAHDGVFDEAKSSGKVNYTLANGAYANVHLPVGQNARWSEHLSQFRLDVDSVKQGNTRFIIDYIAVRHNASVP